MTKRTRILSAILCGLAAPALMAWIELRREFELAALPGAGNAEAMTREAQVAWLVILGAALIGSLCVLTLLSWARGPVATVLAVIGVVVLLLLSPLPIYWLTYRGAPEGLHISISSSRRNAAGLAMVISLTLYWLLGFVTSKARSGEAHAAA